MSRERPDVGGGVAPPQPEEDDLALAKRAAIGDENAFVKIMRRYNQRLFRVAVGVVGEPSEAEDILQESYVRAFSRMSSYTGQGGLGAWLARIVHNEAIDRVRMRTSRSRHLMFEAEMRHQSSDDESSPALQARADEMRSSPEVIAEREEVRALLERAISQLPDTFRAVFVLREVEGLSVDETAEYLSIPPATVKTRDFRARALLRAQLGEQIDTNIPHTFTFLSTRCDSLIDRVLERMRAQRPIHS